MLNSFKTLITSEPQSQILQVTLNRPEVRNAINMDMMQDLLQLWTELKMDKNIRCIILTGASPAFCAGADLKARKDMSVMTWMQQHQVLQRAMLAMIDCPTPIIAAVNGAAFGGGLELTLAADFAYAAITAQFAQSETKLGIIPGAMGTQNLPRACGVRRAKELTLTAKTFNAEEAYQWGIINKVCSSETLLEEVLETANRIVVNAPEANRQAKKALNVAYDLEIKTGYQFEVNCYNTLLPMQDRQEGIAAFNEKRKPNFIGK